MLLCKIYIILYNIHIYFFFKTTPIQYNSKYIHIARNVLELATSSLFMCMNLEMFVLTTNILGQIDKYFVSTAVHDFFYDLTMFSLYNEPAFKWSFRRKYIAGRLKHTFLMKARIKGASIGIRHEINRNMCLLYTGYIYGGISLNSHSKTVIYKTCVLGQII